MSTGDSPFNITVSFQQDGRPSIIEHFRVNPNTRMKRVFDAFNKAYKKRLGRGPAWEAQQTTKKQLESDDTIKTFPIAYMKI